MAGVAVTGDEVTGGEVTGDGRPGDGRRGGDQRGEVIGGQVMGTGKWVSCSYHACIDLQSTLKSVRDTGLKLMRKVSSQNQHATTPEVITLNKGSFFLFLKLSIAYRVPSAVLSCFNVMHDSTSLFLCVRMWSDTQPNCHTSLAGDQGVWCAPN